MRESAISQTEQSSGLLADKILPVLCWIAMVVVAFLFAGTAAAQRPANRVPTDQAKAGGENAMEDAAGSRTQRTGDRRPAKKDRKRRSNAAASEKDEMPEPRPVILKTKDGVDVRAFYFPSDKGKEAIPVLIVHEWQGQASPYLQLVLALRDAGCAVLVPDYRGHGGSVNYMDRRGKERRYDVSRMSKRDVMSIIAMDLEKAKGFLKDENDQGNGRDWDSRRLHHGYDLGRKGLELPKRRSFEAGARCQSNRDGFPRQASQRGTDRPKFERLEHPELADFDCRWQEQSRSQGNSPDCKTNRRCKTSGVRRQDDRF
jgi:hypothetical protein